MIVALGILAAVISIFVSAAFRDLGYKAGQKDGFDHGYWQGRKHADNWWISVESEIDQVRAKIWREEAHL